MGNRPSIVALKTQAAEAAGLEAVPTESRPDDHQANGMVEQVCKETKMHIRVGRSALAEKLNQALGDTDPLLAWLPRHVGDLLNRYPKGSDGKTPEQRRSGKQWRKPAIAFGERLYYKPVGAVARTPSGTIHRACRDVAPASSSSRVLAASGPHWCGGKRFTQPIGIWCIDLKIFKKNKKKSQDQRSKKKTKKTKKIRRSNIYLDKSLGFPRSLRDVNKTRPLGRNKSLGIPRSPSNVKNKRRPFGRNKSLGYPRSPRSSIRKTKMERLRSLSLVAGAGCCCAGAAACLLPMPH